MARVLKKTNVRAIFPGGREVNGYTTVPPSKTDEPFQVWGSETGDGIEVTSILINPSLAESVEFTFQYETSNYGK